MYALKNIPEKLKKLRLYKGYNNQSSAAAALGLSRNWYNEFENGKRNPSIDTILKICNTFGIAISYFYSDGEPEQFDLNPKPRQKAYNLGFAETTVSRFLFSKFNQARSYGSKILINVLYKSGVSFSITEYAAMNPTCIVINAMEGLRKPDRAGIELYIVDHGEDQGEASLKEFLTELFKTNSGIVVIGREPLQLRYFDKEFYLKTLTLNDIDKIVLENFPYIKEMVETEKILKQKILMTISSCIYDDLSKLEDLKIILSRNRLQNFSLYNLFSILEKFIGQEKTS